MITKDHKDQIKLVMHITEPDLMGFVKPYTSDVSKDLYDYEGP